MKPSWRWVGDFGYCSKRRNQKSSWSISALAAKSTIDRTERLNAKIITTPKGERLAILPAEEYEDMCDALIHAQAMADYREGRDESITLAEMQNLLGAPTPLAFWRAKRGLTQTSLAEAAGVSDADVEELESGKLQGSPEVMARLAAALKIRADELLANR